MRALQRSLIVVGVCLAMAGCDTSDGGGSGSGGGQQDKSRVNIAKSSFQGTWPFTVASGELRCEGDSPGFGAVVFNANGEDYGVNGVALDKGYTRVDPIWKKDGSSAGGPRVYIGDVIDRGLKLCGK